MNLVTIILVVNRLSGSIPIELAKISTLKVLNVGYNQLSGNLPPELGNLPQIEKLHFSSNNFTGEIPATFARLTTLTHFRISDNQFSGKIPDFIGSWTNLRKLAIVGSGLSGPIPGGLSSLANLVHLRISNLNGSDSVFPQLNNMTLLTIMILRSCNIVGSLPDFIGKMASLNVVDLSFNKLSGEIPSSFMGLSKVEYLYLSGNLLTGPVPDWLLKSGNNVDLSYNNFSIRNLGPSACEQKKVNLFASSSEGNDSGIIPCLRSCPKLYYSFHINCGGKEVYANGGKKYEEDSDQGEAAQLFLSERSNWAYSNTGNFIDDDDQSPSTSYIWANTSGLSMANFELYTSARLSPISLTYYGFCLGNGNYTVNLHFAEIVFSDDKNYSSLGRRVFDVYVQGKLVQKDFNIAAEAGGARKAVIKKYSVVVNNSALEIRFYWAGKGTTSVPFKGVYGPLISAISVDADFPIPLESGSHLPSGAVITIVVVGAIIMVLLLGILWWRGCSRKKSTLDRVLKGLDLQSGSFTLQQIMAATNNFDITNKIGEGGFGPVYKGFLSDRTIIAVKQLSSKSSQGNREFVNEIGMISALQHPHLVRLYGCCVEGSQLLLVYEYMENNSLARALFDPEKCQLKLNWSTRKKICVGIAKGLAFLHEESRLKIIHRDIKATNVLLDRDLNPKISDFGLAKLYEEDNTHISTRIAGTRGYMAPEYAMHGYLTEKADVYSFGIVALEIISGRTNLTQQAEEECFYYLRDWAHLLKDTGNLMELVDPTLDMEFDEEEVMVMLDVALLCTNNSPTLRPTMSSVVSILEGRPVVQEVVSDESEIVDEMELEATRNSRPPEEENNKNETVSHVSQTTPKSFSDLYPISPNSYYRQKTY